ncbi:hypothetical protein D4764_01G0000120, partial [Takifugu flavidus]
MVVTFINTRANRNSGRQGNTGNSPFFRLSVRTKSMGCRLGTGRSDRKGLTGEEADDVAEQTGDEQQRSRGQVAKSGP